MTGARLPFLVALALWGCGGGPTARPAATPPGDYPEDLPRPSFPVEEIVVGGVPLRVEIADTPARRAYGLMFVRELPDDRGMLFLYPTPRAMTFWMRNTRIPLDIAFLADLGGDVRVVNVHERTEPFRESPGYASTGACKYALEVRGGWFHDHALGVGTRVELSERLLRWRARPDDPARGNLPRRLGPEALEGHREGR